MATAAALAARQLAAASDRPDHAQAFVEMVADRGLLQPQQLQRAVHAVLQAYANKGDHQGVSCRLKQGSAIFAMFASPVIIFVIALVISTVIVPAIIPLKLTAAQLFAELLSGCSGAYPASVGSAGRAN